MKIPPFDLTRATAGSVEPCSPLAEQVEPAAFIGGPEVDRFEEAFAAYLGAAGCVGVANGTDALVVALRALDLAPGDEVIVPAFTFIATGSAVALAGGVPVFADVEPATLNLDPADRSRRGSPTAHRRGHRRPPLRPAVRRRRRSARSAGATASGWSRTRPRPTARASADRRKSAPSATLACWSFYPTKNLGAFGDAGAVTGNDPALLDRVRRIANHGRTEHYLHGELGTNSRLDALQAAVLTLRLPGLDDANRRRREIAARYRGGAGRGSTASTCSPDPDGTEPVYHQFTLLSRPARRPARAPGRGAGSAPRSTTRSRSTASRRSRAFVADGRLAAGLRAGRGAGAVACPCSRSSGRRGGGGGGGGAGVLRLLIDTFPRPPAELRAALRRSGWSGPGSAGRSARDGRGPRSPPPGT